MGRVTTVVPRTDRFLQRLATSMKPIPGAPIVIEIIFTIFARGARSVAALK